MAPKLEQGHPQTLRQASRAALGPGEMRIAIDPPPRHKFRELVSGPFMPDALVPAYFMTWLAALVPTPRVNLTRFDSPFARTPAQQQLPGLHELG